MECYCPHGSLFDLISTDSNCKYVYDTLSGQAVFFAKKISSKVELLLQHCFALSCMILFVGKISVLAPCRKLYRSERANQGGLQCSNSGGKKKNKKTKRAYKIQIEAARQTDIDEAAAGSNIQQIVSKCHSLSQDMNESIEIPQGTHTMISRIKLEQI